jgi:hypothetical protein
VVTILQTTDECSFCDGKAYVFREYSRTGLVYACEDCAVMLDDSVDEIGSPVSEGKLSTACG